MKKIRIPLRGMPSQLHVLMVMIAGWINRHQNAVIDYLQEKNRVLREMLGCRPLRFSDFQRVRLGRKAHAVGRRCRLNIATLVTPDTLLRWFCRLVAKKWTTSKTGRPSRPKIDPDFERLFLRFMTENPTWGSDRIVGALSNLGFIVSDSTRDNVRRRNGFAPAPERGRTTTWKQFLQAHWDGLIAADFFTTEVLSFHGLITFYTLFVIDPPSRFAHVCGTTVAPNAEWMTQVARNLADAIDGFARTKTAPDPGRGSKCSAAFKKILRASGIEVILCPPRGPRCNAFAGRSVRSTKVECLGRMIFFGEAHLKSPTSTYVGHYNRQRNHQGLENKLIAPNFLPPAGDIAREKHLGGMLNYYYRIAASSACFHGMAEFFGHTTLRVSRESIKLRARNTSGNLRRSSITTSERLSFLLLILHLNAAFRAIQAGLLQRSEEVIRNIQAFLSLPISEAV